MFSSNIVILYHKKDDVHNKMMKFCYFFQAAAEMEYLLNMDTTSET